MDSWARMECDCSHAAPTPFTCHLKLPLGVPAILCSWEI